MILKVFLVTVLLVAYVISLANGHFFLGKGAMYSSFWITSEKLKKNAVAQLECESVNLCVLSMAM